MTTMQVVHVPNPGADCEVVARAILEPGSGHVRMRLPAWGGCHRDVITTESLFPGMLYPHMPGHERAGVIDVVGAGGKDWKKGIQRYGAQRRLNLHFGGA